VNELKLSMAEMLGGRKRRMWEVGIAAAEDRRTLKTVAHSVVSCSRNYTFQN